MQHKHTIVEPTINYLKQPFNVKPVADSVTPVLHKNHCDARQKNYYQSGGAKKDSLILHDFFGALNY